MELDEVPVCHIDGDTARLRHVAEQTLRLSESDRPNMHQDAQVDSGVESRFGIFQIGVAVFCSGEVDGATLTAVHAGDKARLLECCLDACVGSDDGTTAVAVVEREDEDSSRD